MDPVQIAALGASSLMALLAVFQLLLFAGLPLGHLAWGGRVKRLPMKLRMASLTSALILVLGILLVLERADRLSLVGAPVLTRISMWILTALFALSTLGNLSSASRSEKTVMTPVAVILSASCLILALG